MGPDFECAYMSVWDFVFHVCEDKQNIPVYSFPKDRQEEMVWKIR